MKQNTPPQEAQDIGYLIISFYLSKNDFNYEKTQIEIKIIETFHWDEILVPYDWREVI